MREDKETMFEMMLTADRFCAEAQGLADDLAGQEREELRLKLVQCQTLLQQLRSLYEEENLTIDNAAACGHFRQLIMALMWMAYRARKNIGFKLFRKLVMIESSFTYLLIMRGHASNSDGHVA